MKCFTTRTSVSLSHSTQVPSRLYSFPSRYFSLQIFAYIGTTCYSPHRLVLFPLSSLPFHSTFPYHLVVTQSLEPTISRIAPFRPHSFVFYLRIPYHFPNLLFHVLRNALLAFFFCPRTPCHARLSLSNRRLPRTRFSYRIDEWRPRQLKKTLHDLRARPPCPPASGNTRRVAHRFPDVTDVKGSGSDVRSIIAIE